jgi:pyruvate formate lyase activating enzyme
MSLNYGRLITEAIDPIEKKPLFHFLPGSLSYSIATVGCNLRCDNCQNWQISQWKVGSQKSEVGSSKLKDSRELATYDLQLPGYDVRPDEIIERTIKSGCQSISYTYTEPTIFFEFALDCMKLAHQHKLYNVWVSNGYMSKWCLDGILPYLDAINVDLKFFEDKYYLKNCGCRLKPILENLQYFQQHKVLQEVTTLLIPGLTDIDNQPKRIAEFMAKELSIDVPWHISRFSPEISYKMQNGQTTANKLIDEVYQIGKRAGLDYVYVGNVWGDDRENTYCPKCKNLVIERCGYNIKRFDNDGKCPQCGYTLSIKIQEPRIKEVLSNKF